MAQPYGRKFKQNLGMCRLCLENKELRKSHVLPEFLYNPIYGASHKFLEISADIDRPKTFQKGYRERLLCQECEGHLSRTCESEFSRAYKLDFNWRQAKFLGRTSSGREVRQCSGLNYGTIKLFTLSLLWRMSISKKEFTGGGVNLGPHEERIRSLLLAAIPPAESVYPVVMYRFLHGGELAKIIMTPYFSRDGKFHSYFISYPGYFVQINVGSSSLMKDSLIHLKTNGTIIVGELDFEDLPVYPKVADWIEGAENVNWFRKEIENQNPER